MNLITNAIKFTPNGGKIILRARKISADKLFISVSDNGIGIKKQDKPRLFKLYGSIQNMQQNSKGIGIGLAFCKMIIEKFDGKIDFVSKWKRGSTFFFTFELK